MEDREIIALLFQRSQQALGELDRKYGTLCRRLALRILNDRQDAEECVNDAYLAIWNAIPPASPESLSPYLCRVVRNLALKAYERRGAAKRGGGYTVAMEELEECLAGPETVEDALEGKELVRVIERFLDTLTEEDRRLFLGRYWFAASYGEIGRRMGLTEKAVSVRLVRIRRRLKDYLRKEEVLP